MDLDPLDISEAQSPVLLFVKTLGGKKKKNVPYLSLRLLHSWAPATSKERQGVKHYRRWFLWRQFCT